MWLFEGASFSLTTKPLCLPSLGRYGEPEGDQRGRQTGGSVWILVAIIRQRDPVSSGEYIYYDTPPLSRPTRSAPRSLKNLVWRRWFDASEPSWTWKPVCLRALWRTKSIIAHLPPAHCQGWSINKLDWELWTCAFAFQWLMKWPKLWSCALLNSLVTSCQSGSLSRSLQALCCCCSIKHTSEMEKKSLNVKSKCGHSLPQGRWTVLFGVRYRPVIECSYVQSCKVSDSHPEMRHT